MEDKKSCKEYEDFRFAKDMVTTFKGTAKKCEVEQAQECFFYGKHKDKSCGILERENCLGCSFFTTEEVPAFEELRNKNTRKSKSKSS